MMMKQNTTDKQATEGEANRKVSSVDIRSQCWKQLFARSEASG